VLANGFYEWHTEGKIKQPYLIQLNSGAPFAFAGLWEFWVSPDDGGGSLLHDHHDGPQRGGRAAA
jgi:putative SOS response-associated peptidase YedK